MQKKLTVLFAFAIFLLLVGWAITPVTTTLANPDCSRHPDNRHCSGGGEDSVTYTAELIGGAFLFGAAAVVTPNVKEISLQRLEGFLTLNRPTSDPDRFVWDSVFDTCANLLGAMAADVLTVTSFTVDDPSWKINKDGGVRFIFIDIPFNDSGGNPFAEVTVQLIGNTFDFGIDGNDPFLPEADETSTFVLNQFAIHGSTVRGIHPREGCQDQGGGSFDIFPLLDSGGNPVPSTLVITATAS